MVSDGTEEPKGEDSTPEVEQETPKFTQKDIEKIKVDARTAAEAEVGRATKAAQTAAQQAERAQERLSKFIKQAREAELQLNQEQPDALSVIRARHAKEELEDELADKNTELEEARETILKIETSSRQSMKEQDAHEIATRFQVEESDLTEFTDGSKEAMGKLAQRLTKGDTQSLRLDPGGGVGGSKSLEALLKVDTKKMDYQQILDHEKELKSALKA